ncbi:GntR family transcriptional regulator [Slackia piriformis]|uniref:GntR family transcriptional regulator n=1 Tax=Slackia piriformis TaxID=626934 RepID=UPI0026DBE8DB|nr:GntR family transcriptional regulator [Slackia piriformis]MDO5024680.1 GntR family transcriptional regulator [Slackia piriformis]
MNALESFAIDYDSGLPVWVQVKNRIAYLIGTGKFAPGDRLPTVRALALDLDISYNTVNRAYMDLERDGYVSTRKGRGTFVADCVGNDVPEFDGAVILLVDEMIKTALGAGMGPEDIVCLVQKQLSDRFS